MQWLPATLFLENVGELMLLSDLVDILVRSN